MPGASKLRAARGRVLHDVAAVVAESARYVADTTVAADRALPGESKSSVHRVLIHMMVLRCLMLTS